MIVQSGEGVLQLGGTMVGKKAGLAPANISVPDSTVANATH